MHSFLSSKSFTFFILLFCSSPQLIYLWSNNSIAFDFLDGARPPVNVKVKSVSYNFFTIQWDHAGDEITGYQLTVSHHSTVVREATTEKTATEYTFDNMSPTTSYDVSIMAVGEDTNSFPVTLMANTTARPIIGRNKFTL